MIVRMMGAALPAAALLLGACATERTTGRGVERAEATATLRAADGGERGRVAVLPAGNGIRLTVEASGLTPGRHGLHVHAVGRCDPPDFTSAGPHWNPDARAHGRDNPAGAHRGDLPNIEIAADGRGRLVFDLPVAAAALLEGEGKALIIHADADDYRTDPGGNSGGRLVCGVFAAG